MTIGRRRHPVEIQKYSSAQDPQTGEMVQGWATIGTEWASIEGINGREFIAAAAEQSATTTRVTMAYRDDLTTTHRLVYHGKKYNLKAILPNNTRTEMVCMCEVGLI